MKVMVIVKATERSEAGLMPDEKLLADMGHFNTQLAEAGILETGEGLLASSKGARVRFSGANRTVTTGPFANPSELVAGFWIWRVKSLDEAIEWVKRCPNPMPTDCDIEIRPMMEQDCESDTAKPDTREADAAATAQLLGLTVRFENSKELVIAGLKQNYMFASRTAIPAQWQRFMPYIGQVAGQVGKVAYGVCTNNSTNDGFAYLSGVQVAQTNALPGEFESLPIPAHRYAIVSHSGHVSNIAQTIDTIWKQWLPTSGLKAAASPCFEKYTEQFNPLSGTGGMEIWVPLHV